MSDIQRENWGSKLGFILSVAGSAIGLGNIWRFPYIAGENGGGAFLVVYLACVLLVGLPIMVCELAIGRNAQTGAVGAFAKIFPGKSKLSRTLGVLTFFGGIVILFSNHIGSGLLVAGLGLAMIKWGFKSAGPLALIVAMIILSYYSVIGGWIIEYTVKSFQPNSFAQLETVPAAKDALIGFLGTPWRVVLWHFVFLGLSAAMLWGGIKGGIERWSKILLPMLFLLLLVVIIRSLTLPGASKGLTFLFHPDFSKLQPSVFLAAIGHSFYSLSLGMAISITYGSYQTKHDNLYSSALSVISLDTLGAILAGVAIFPAVFAMNMDPAAGTGLVFQVLPATFNRIPLGWLWSGLFFIMLAIAALTSAASLMECGVTFLLDHTKLKRHGAIILVYVIIGLFGVLSCVSILDWSNLEPVHKFLVRFFGETLANGDWLDFLDTFCNNFILPITALLTALFAGWAWTTRKATDELRMGAEKIADKNLLIWSAGLLDDEAYCAAAERHGLTFSSLWAFAIRYIAPLAIVAIFLSAIGLL